MLKKFTISLFAFTLLGIFVSSAFAKTVVVKTTPSPTPTATPEVVNSYGLFWPMVSGRTMQSKIYFLKTLKEEIRGFFIFGSAQKTDYRIYLGIKRMIEAEALMKGNVPDLANKTLDSAISDFNKANSSLTDAKNSSNVDKGTKDEINTRVTNLKKFTNYLIITYPSYRDKLQEIIGKLNSLSL